MREENDVFNYVWPKCTKESSGPKAKCNYEIKKLEKLSISSSICRILIGIHAQDTSVLSSQSSPIVWSIQLTWKEKKTRKIVS